jgi:hypothetical protein
MELNAPLGKREVSTPQTNRRCSKGTDPRFLSVVGNFRKIKSYHWIKAVIGKCMPADIRRWKVIYSLKFHRNQRISTQNCCQPRNVGRNSVEKVLHTTFGLIKIPIYRMALISLLSTNF